MEEAENRCKWKTSGPVIGTRAKLRRQDTTHFGWVMEYLKEVEDTRSKAICMWFGKYWRAIKALNDMA